VLFRKIGVDQLSSERGKVRNAESEEFKRSQVESGRISMSTEEKGGTELVWKPEEAMERTRRQRASIGLEKFGLSSSVRINIYARVTFNPVSAHPPSLIS
jgi:hypothetical protein